MYVMTVCTRTVNISCFYFCTILEYNNVLIWTSWETSTLY